MYCGELNSYMEVINEKNKENGPNIDPWGTPILIGLSEDVALLKVICCFLSSRNNINHLLNHLSHIP